MSSAHILDSVWELDSAAMDERVANVYIRSLREKIELLPGKITPIQFFRKFTLDSPPTGGSILQTLKAFIS